jgi:hypothetical protein
VIKILSCKCLSRGGYRTIHIFFAPTSGTLEKISYISGSIRNMFNTVYVVSKIYLLIVGSCVFTFLNTSHSFSYEITLEPTSPQPHYNLQAYRCRLRLLALIGRRCTA